MAIERPRGWAAVVALALFFGRPLALAALVFYLFVRDAAWRDPVAITLGIVVAALWAGWRLKMVSVHRQVREQLGADVSPAP